MLPAFALVVCCCDPSVSLADIERFGVSPAIAKFQWEWSRDHIPLMRDTVRTWNRADVADCWEAEMYWRCRSWDLLDFLLRVDQTDRAKLEHLSELKRLLGEPAYRAGWMPSPIPSYRP